MAKKILKILMLFLLVTSANSFSQNLELALKNYQNSDFSGAKKLLEEAVQKSPEDTLLLYNLGLVEYKLGNLGYASALWRKAQNLSPREPLLRQALAFVESQNPQIQASELYSLHPYIVTISNYLPSEIAFLIGLLFLFFASNRLFVYISKNRTARLNEEVPPPFEFSVFGYILVASLFFTLPLNTFWVRLSTQATVISKEATGKSGPSTDNASLFTLKEGEPVFILDKQNGWYKIKDRVGRLGWSQESELFITSVNL